MNNNMLIYLSLFLLSGSVLCFEIVSTRIASVIFVQNYAFIILCLALLGLGNGGVFSYYRFKSKENPSRILLQSFFLLGVSLCLFIVAVIELALTNSFIFFVLLFLPFLISGIAYAQIYKTYSALSFPLYAVDLSGAAVGSVASLGLIGILGAPNSILLLALVMFCLSTVLMRTGLSAKKRTYAYLVLFVLPITNHRQPLEHLRKVGSGEIQSSGYGSTTFHRRCCRHPSVPLQRKHPKYQFYSAGIPFPSCIQMLTVNKQERYIPWLCGVNGLMSVLGSVLAVILSMLVGFTPTYFAGLSFYLCIPLLLYFSRKNVISGSARLGSAILQN